MHPIYFYRDKQGRRPVIEYLDELAARKDKDSRIKLNKINDYIEALSREGTRLGKPYVKQATCGNCVLCVTASSLSRGTRAVLFSSIMS